MRIVELGKIAVGAEKIRLQLIARRQTRRVICVGVAATFGLIVLCMFHVLLWNVIALQFGPLWASAILLMLDIVIAGGFGFVGARSKPSQTEIAADEVRRMALEHAQGAILLALLPATTLLGRAAGKGGLSLGQNIWRYFNRKGA